MPDLFVAGKDRSKEEKKVETEPSVGQETDPATNKVPNPQNNKVKEIYDNIRKNKIAEESGALKYPLSEDAAAKLPGHTNNPLASYIYFPFRADFISRDPQEKIVLLLRKHPITNLKWVVMTFFLIIAPAFLTILPIYEQAPATYRVFAIMAWYLFSFAYSFEKFLNWFFSVNIITDERIFDVDFHNLIYRRMTDANIDQIQDVTVQMGGGIRTMFNYGDVFIQTAAETPEIEFEVIPYPDRVAKILRELRIEEEVEKLEGRVR